MRCKCGEKTDKRRVVSQLTAYLSVFKRFQHHFKLKSGRVSTKLEADWCVLVVTVLGYHYATENFTWRFIAVIVKSRKMTRDCWARLMIQVEGATACTAASPRIMTAECGASAAVTGCANSSYLSVLHTNTCMICDS